MKTFEVEVNGHRIDIAASRWNGKEVVRYDGEVVSEKRNIATMVGVHAFEQDEAGVRVSYEVNVLGGVLDGIGFVVRRNGLVVAAAP